MYDVHVHIHISVSLSLSMCLSAFLSVITQKLICVYKPNLLNCHRMENAKKEFRLGASLNKGITFFV